MIICPHCSEAIAEPYQRNPQTSFHSSNAVYQHFQHLCNKEVEEFHAVMLNVKSEIIADEVISVGSLSATLVHPREAFKAAVRAPAHAVIFVHNHPSGHCQPSDEDITLTRRLVQAGVLLGIKVNDHVIVAGGQYFSFADEGRLQI